MYRDDLIKAAALVKELGQVPLRGGKSLRDSLEYDGVSLWDVMASELTLYRFLKVVQRALGTTDTVPELRTVGSLKQQVKLRLRDLRNMVVETFGAWRYPPCPEGSREKDGILFLNFVDRQSDALWPLVDVLQRRKVGPLYFLVSRHSRIIPRLRSLEVPFMVLETCSAYRQVKRLHEFRHQIRETLYDLRREGEWKRPFKLRGVHPDSLLDGVWVRLFNDVFPCYAVNLLRARSCLERLKPALVVSTDVNHALVKLFCEVGRRLNVPSLNVQYGLTTHESIEWSFMSQTRAAVFGLETVRMLDVWRVPARRLVPCGPTRYDRIEELVGDRDQIRRALGSGPDERIILFLSVPYHYEGFGGPDGRLSRHQHARLLELMRALPHRLANVRIVFRPHPEEPKAFFRKMRLKKGEAEKVCVDEFHSALQLINACDLAITWHSTTGLEVIILGKPLVTVNFTREPDPFPYAKDGGAVGVYDEAELVPTISRLLEDSDARKRLSSTQQDFLKKHLFECDGKASERVADLIDSMICSQA